MPTYEYACKNCGNQLEVVQKFSDDPLTECPDCGGQLRKVFGSIGISFKGSGFYKNDSRSTASGKSGEDKSSGTGDGGSSSEKSGDKGDSGSSGDKSGAKATTEAKAKPVKSSDAKAS